MHAYIHTYLIKEGVLDSSYLLVGVVSVHNQKMWEERQKGKFLYCS